MNYLQWAINQVFTDLQVSLFTLFLGLLVLWFSWDKEMKGKIFAPFLSGLMISLAILGLLFYSGSLCRECSTLCKLPTPAPFVSNR